MARTCFLAGWVAALLTLFASQSPATTASKMVFAASDGVYLNPNTGRFWTMDSFYGSSSDPLTLHKYLYAYGNPINIFDPSGHDGDLISMQMTTFISGYIRAGVSGAIINAAGSALLFNETTTKDYQWNLATGFLTGGLGSFTKLGGNFLISKFGLQGAAKISLTFGRLSINAIASTAATVGKEKYADGKDVSNERIAYLLAANFAIGTAVDYAETGLEEVSTDAKNALERLKEYSGKGWPNGWSQLTPAERSFQQIMLKLAADPLDGNIWLGGIINIQKEIARWCVDTAAEKSE